MKGGLLLVICILAFASPVLGAYSVTITPQSSPEVLSQYVTIKVDDISRQYSEDKIEIFVGTDINNNMYLLAGEPVKTCSQSINGETSLPCTYSNTYSQGTYAVMIGITPPSSSSYEISGYFSVGSSEAICKDQYGENNWHDDISAEHSYINACCGDQEDDHGRIFSMNDGSYLYCNIEDGTRQEGWNVLQVNDCNADFFETYNVIIGQFPADYCDEGEVLYYDGVEYLSKTSATGRIWAASAGNCGGNYVPEIVSAQPPISYLDSSPLTYEDSINPPQCVQQSQSESACSDGIDNDCDGYIDLCDDDCTASRGTCEYSGGFQVGAASCVSGYEVSGSGNTCECVPEEGTCTQIPYDDAGPSVTYDNPFWAACSNNHVNVPDWPDGPLRGGYNFAPNDPTSDILRCTGQDNVYYYCVEDNAGGASAWVIDLDDSKYETACIAYHDWTGSYCCGEADDPEESYNDAGGSGACYKDTYQRNDEFLTVNGNAVRTVLVSDGQFYGCDIGGGTLMDHPNPGGGGAERGVLVDEKYFCDQISSKYCSPNTGNWEDITSGIGSERKISLSGAIGCCEANQCWNGNSCVQEGANSEINGDTKTCIIGSDGTASWDFDLDDNEQECTAAGYTWTGTYCCSEPDDNDESYIDPSPTENHMGCFLKEPQSNGGFLVFDSDSGSTSTQVYVYNNEFHGCNVGGTEFMTVMDHPNPGSGGSSSGNLITPYSSCQQLQEPDIFCTPGGEWMPADGATLTEKTYLDGYLPNPENPSVGCCEASQCWDGSACVNPGESGSDIDLGDTRFSCTDQNGIGTWTSPQQKENPDGTEPGYCDDDNQCFLENDGTSDICIDDGQWNGDDYCRTGEWTTRTRLVADKLLDIANNNNEYGSGTDFELLCDEKTSSLRINLDLSGSSISNYCVLSSGSGNDVILGAAVGSAENSGSADIDAFIPDLTAAYNSAYGTQEAGGSCSGTSNFQKCIDLQYMKVYYDDGQGLVLIAPKNGLVDPNWQDTLGSIWASVSSLFTGTHKIKEVDNFDKLYMSKKGSKEIISVYETLYDSSGNPDDYLTFNYKSVQADQNEIVGLANPESSEVRDIESGRTVIFMKNPEQEAWHLLGARIELK